MAKTELKLTLERPARKTGGDRYETEKTDKVDSFHIYIPQSISRTGGDPAGEFKVVIS